MWGGGQLCCFSGNLLLPLASYTIVACRQCSALIQLPLWYMLRQCKPQKAGLGRSQLGVQCISASSLCLPRLLILRSLVSAAVKCIATSFLVLQQISDAQPNIRCCNISQMRKRMMLKQFRATDATLSENPILLKIKLTFAHFFLEFSLSSLWMWFECCPYMLWSCCSQIML